jgi:FK506-binding protein 2
MRFIAVSIAVLASAATTVLAADVKIEVTRAVECERKSKKGDKISVHYRGNLEEDGKVGKQFDASYDRGQPLDFVVGKGSVIKGSVHKRQVYAGELMLIMMADGMITCLICALARRELLRSPLSMDMVTETWDLSPLEAH